MISFSFVLFACLMLSDKSCFHAILEECVLKHFSLHEITEQLPSSTVVSLCVLI